MPARTPCVGASSAPIDRRAPAAYALTVRKTRVYRSASVRDRRSRPDPRRVEEESRGLGQRRPVFQSKGSTTMDYSRLDPCRRQASAQELDLVEAYAAGRISRRTFMTRATVLGLSLPTISMLIAACGGAPAASGGASTAPSAAASSGASSPPASAAAGGTIRIA